MKLLLQREPKGKDWTFGKLFVNGVAECDTLEDRVRDVAGRPVKEWKVPGRTAIPRGNYKLTLHNSPRFKTVLPMLIDVEGYSYVLIHWGNFHEDTEGCILVGKGRTASAIINSKVEFARLFRKIKQAMDAGEEVWLEVR